MTPKRPILSGIVGGVIVGLLVGGVLTACDESNQRGTGDAPVGTFDDSPAQVINMPDQFMNVAFKCFGVNGIYAHTRAAAPVIVPNDPMCKEPG